LDGLKGKRVDPKRVPEHQERKAPIIDALTAAVVEIGER
jgi:hypothetical protein